MTMNTTTTTMRDRVRRTGFVVGLNGLPGCGKDTLADYLCEVYGFEKYAFADELYSDLASSFGVSEKDLKSREWKTVPQGLLSLNCCNNGGYRNFMTQRGYGLDEPRTSRFHAQNYGQEYVRSHNPLEWVERLDYLVSTRRPRLLVIPDVRNMNEAYYIKWLASRDSRKRIMCRIERDGCTHTGHSTDNTLPEDFYTHTINNVTGEQDRFISEFDSFIERLL